MKSLYFWLDNALMGDVYIALRDLPEVSTQARIRSRTIFVPGHVFLCKRNGILCHDCLTGRRVSRNEHGIPHLEMVHCLFLKGVEFERILKC